MGRYAFFTTGFEYKFRFAVQSSEDILAFGGIAIFVYEGDPEHKWNITDRKRIESTLHDLEDALQLPTLKVDSYTKDLHGTSALYSDLHSLTHENLELLAKYSLGCILWHQLLYCLDLKCTYET
jgi:hypothetical protein